MQKTFIIFFLFLIILPFQAQGYVLSDFVNLDTFPTKVENNVDFNVSTGNNQVSSGGKIDQGTSKVKVDVKTKINDQEIEPIKIDVEQKDSASVNVKQKIKADNDQIEVNQKVKTNDDTEANNYEINLNEENNNTQAIKIQNEENKSSAENKPKNIVRKFSNWWSILLENLRLTIANIFKLL